jgi:hypothetical protein
MKKFFLSLIIILFAAGLTAEEAPIRGPRIFCETQTFDFGTADSQSSVTHTFVLQNIGDTTLEITNIRAACGCTVANVSSREVPPGGTSELTAVLNLQGRQGYQSKSITITSNDPENSNYIVTMAGTATRAVSITPDRLMFGQITSGQEVSLPIDIESTGETPVTIQQIETGSENITVEQESSADGKRIRLNVKMRGGIRPGDQNTTIRLVTSHPERPVIDIPVFASIAGALMYAPQELVLPANVDAPLTRYIVLRSGGVESFEITGIELPDESMTTAILPFGSQGFRIQIDNISPRPDLHDTKVKISTSSAAMPLIEVPLRINP